MRTKIVTLWTCLLSLSWQVQGGGEGSGVVTDNDLQRRSLSPFEEGLQPFYQMTNVFLGIVQNKDLASANPMLYNQLSSLVSAGQDPQTEEGSFFLFTENWKSLTLYGLGYIVCVGLGLLFIIVMPLVGFFFCCCRLCGQCGGKVKPREGRHHKCRQYTCGTLLFIFTTFMLVGMVFAFMTNEQIRIRASQHPDGLVPTLRRWLGSLRGFTDTVIGDTRNTLDVEVEIKLNNILKQLNGLPDAAITTMDKLTNSTAILASAESLATSVKMMKKLLGDVDTKKTDLINLTTTLSNKLVDIKSNILAIISGCTTAICTSLENDIKSLEVSVDFSQTNHDITSQISKLNGLGDIDKFIKERETSYNLIKDRVNATSRSAVTDVTEKKKNILSNIKERVDDLIITLNDLMAPIKEADDFLTETVQPPLETYREYYWYAAIGLSCVFLLIVLCFYLGLMFGVCGEPPYDDSTACNKGVGANLLLGGVGFCFLFCWLLMLVCMLLFLPGAILQGEVCRHISPNVTDSIYMPLIDKVTYPFIQMVNLTNNVSKILNQCRLNQGAYSAFGLQNLIDLDVLDIDQYNLKENTDKLKTLKIDLSGVVVIDDNLKNQLETVRDSTLDDINFTAFFIELNKKVTSKQLTMVISQMTGIKSSLTPTKATELQVEITALQNIQDTEVKTIDEKRGDLRAALDGLQNLIDGQKGRVRTLKQKTQELINSLTDAQTKIDSGDAVTDITSMFVATADRLYQQLVDFAAATNATIMNDLGKCGRLYSIVSGTIDVVCIDFLYPFNGFWFSFGWCLAFFIPAIITAVHLAGSYRKTEEFDPSDTKSFDDPNFDAYSGGMFPGDNIPLEDYDRRKNRPGAAGRGQPNTAYERDAHPSSHAPPAAMPYRDNYSRDNYVRNGRPPAYPAREQQGGYGGRRGGNYGGATPPNPPHYYNNRPGPY